MAKKDFRTSDRKIPRQLQIDDPFYKIVKRKMTSESRLSSYAVEIEYVQELRKDKTKDGNILINGRISAPGDGYGTLNSESVIVDELDAIELVTALIKEEEELALDNIDATEKQLKIDNLGLEGVRKNLKIYEGKTKLNNPEKVIIAFEDAEKEPFSNKEDVE